ncbi:MAG: hypothetical protein JNM84_16220, partial [Planctomycetes bacterium]|nr:hypothetical protein [Planctomycetota bacterium]
MPRIRRLGQVFGLALLSASGTRGDCVAQEMPRLPIFFVENPASSAEVPVYSGRAQAFVAEFYRDRIALRRSDGAQQAAVALRFAGAAATPVAEEALPGKLNVFVGEATNWRTGLALHGALRYRSLWPGVDLVVHGREGELQY